MIVGLGPAPTAAPGLTAATGPPRRPSPYCRHRGFSARLRALFPRWRWGRGVPRSRLWVWCSSTRTFPTVGGDGCLVSGRAASARSATGKCSISSMINSYSGSDLGELLLSRCELRAGPGEGCDSGLLPAPMPASALAVGLVLDYGLFSHGGRAWGGPHRFQRGFSARLRALSQRWAGRGLVSGAGRSRLTRRKRAITSQIAGSRRGHRG